MLKLKYYFVHSIVYHSPPTGSIYPVVMRMLSTTAHATKTTMNPSNEYFIIDLAFSKPDELPPAKTYRNPPIAIAMRAMAPESLTMNSIISCPMRKSEHRSHGLVSVHGVSGSLQFFPQGMRPPEPAMLQVEGLQSGSPQSGRHPSPAAQVGVLKAALAVSGPIEKSRKDTTKTAMNMVNILSVTFFISFCLLVEIRS